MSDIIKEAREALEGVTRGPWYEGGNNGGGKPTIIYSDDATGSAIAETALSMVHRSKEECEANTRFIAWCRKGVPALIARAEAAEAALARAYMAGLDDAEAIAHNRWVLRSEHAAKFFEMGCPEYKIDSARAEEARAISVKIRAMPVPSDLAKRLGVSDE